MDLSCIAASVEGNRSGTYRAVYWVSHGTGVTARTENR
jgi:hypothetical protein